MKVTLPIMHDTVVTQADDQVSTDLDGEIILMTIDQGAYFGFDKILSRIWTLIESPMAVSALCDKLLEEFEVERSVCERDVLKVLNDLLEEKLVKVP